MNGKLRVIRTHPYYPNFVKIGDTFEQYEVYLDNFNHPYVRVMSSHYHFMNGGFGMDIPINIDFCDLEVIESEENEKCG